MFRQAHPSERLSAGNTLSQLEIPGRACGGAGVWRAQGPARGNLCFFLYNTLRTA